MTRLDNNQLKQVTLPCLIGENGLFSDGDWVESKDQDQNGEMRLIQLADVGVGEYLDKSARFMTSEKAEKLKCTYLKEGDILIARMPDPIGRACVFPGDAKLCVTVVDVCILRPDQSFVDSNWLLHRINSPGFNHEISKWVTGTTRQRISRGNLSKISFSLPTLPEQKRIAAILDKADAIRRKRRQAIQLADEFLRSVFFDIFGDPVINPNKWKMKTLGSIAIKFSDGPFGSNLKTSHYVDAGVRVVRLQNIGVDEFLNDDKMYISFDHFRKLIKHRCVPGDLIIGTLGDPNLRACILPSYITEALNKADCIQFRVDPNQATNEYVCSLINHTGMLTLVYPLMHGQTRTRISMGTLKNLKVPIPPISEQKRFSSIYRNQKKIISKNENMSLESDNLFVSLTQKAFRGEL